MWKTVTVNSLSAIGDRFICVSQEDEKDPTKKRYAIINSDTLDVVKSFTGDLAKNEFSAEIAAMITADRETSRIKEVQDLIA